MMLSPEGGWRRIRLGLLVAIPIFMHMSERTRFAIRICPVWRRETCDSVVIHRSTFHFRSAGSYRHLDHLGVAAALKRTIGLCPTFIRNPANATTRAIRLGDCLKRVVTGTSFGTRSWRVARGRTSWAQACIISV